MRYLKRYSTDADYNSDKNNLQWPTVCGIDDGEQSRFIEDVEELGATVTMYPDKKVYTLEDTTIQSTIIVAHNLTEPCDIELSCEDSNVTINQDTFTNVIGAVSTYMTYPLTTQDGVSGSKTFEVTAEITSADQSIEEDAELVVNNILPRVIPITITSGSNSKSYDGTSLQNNTVTVTSGSLQSGDNISYSGFGQQTLVGSSNNIFNYTITPATSASKYNVTQQFGTLTVTDGTGVGDEPVDPELVIWIEETSEPENSGGYVVGETIFFSVNVRNIYSEEQDITLSSIEGLTLWERSFDNVMGGQSISTTATYVVTESDALAESYTATVSATVGNLTKTAEITVNTQILDLVLSSGSSSKSYDATPLEEQTVTMTSGSLCSGDAITYNISGRQLFVGSSDNTFTYTITPAASAYKYNVTRQFGTLTVTDTNVEDSLVITVSAESPSNGYGYGDEVEFRVTATNIYDTVIDIDLSAITGMTLAQAYFNRVSSGETVQTTAIHTIDDSDILNGSFTGTVTAYLGSNNVSPLNYSLSATDSATVLTESLNGHLTVNKVAGSEPENGETYDLGEIIEYNIWVENDGNLTITDITITDELTGDEWSCDSLAPGNAWPKTNGVLDPLTAEYYVGEDDILVGEVLNIATATGTSPDPDEPDVIAEEGVDPEPTVDPDGHLTMHIEETSTPQNGNYYQLGETVTYNVWIENDGNLTIFDITPSDNVNGNYTWQDNTAIPKESYPQNSSYVLTPWQKSYAITQADVNAGNKDIIATATGESPDPDNPDATVASATLTIVTNMV